MRVVIGMFFIFLLLAGLYYQQHPESFKDKVSQGIKILSIVKKDKVDTDDIILPSIPILKNKASEVSSTPIPNKKLITLSHEQLGHSHYNFIHSLYREVLDREPTSEEEEKWLNALLQGASRDAVYRGVTLGREYLEKEYDENHPEVSETYLSFVQYYSKTYLNIELPMDKLKKTSNWQISKHLVNKSLELIDYFASTDLDALCRWYAVLSSDFAQRFKIWNPQQDKMRTFTSKKFHYQWAEKVPLDFVKSEVILKIHKVLNGL